MHFTAYHFWQATYLKTMVFFFLLWNDEIVAYFNFYLGFSLPLPFKGNIAIFDAFYSRKQGVFGFKDKIEY